MCAKEHGATITIIDTCYPEINLTIPLSPTNIIKAVNNQFPDYDYLETQTAIDYEESSC